MEGGKDEPTRYTGLDNTRDERGFDSELSGDNWNRDFSYDYGTLDKEEADPLGKVRDYVVDATKYTIERNIEKVKKADEQARELLNKFFDKTEKITGGRNMFYNASPDKKDLIKAIFLSPLEPLGISNFVSAFDMDREGEKWQSATDIKENYYETREETNGIAEDAQKREQATYEKYKDNFGEINPETQQAEWTGSESEYNKYQEEVNGNEKYRETIIDTWGNNVIRGLKDIGIYLLPETKGDLIVTTAESALAGKLLKESLTAYQTFMVTHPKIAWTVTQAGRATMVPEAYVAFDPKDEYSKRQQLIAGGLLAFDVAQEAYPLYLKMKGYIDPMEVPEFKKIYAGLPDNLKPEFEATVRAWGKTRGINTGKIRDIIGDFTHAKLQQFSPDEAIWADKFLKNLPDIKYYKGSGGIATWVDELPTGFKPQDADIVIQKKLLPQISKTTHKLDTRNLDALRNQIRRYDVTKMIDDIKPKTNWLPDNDIHKLTKQNAIEHGAVMTGSNTLNRYIDEPLRTFDADFKAPNPEEFIKSIWNKIL